MPFSNAEHTVIIIMANAAISPAYALNLTITLDKYYLLPKGVGFDMLLVLSTQMLGYAFAGLCRRFLVWPAGMIWPSNLVICTLLNTFHAEDDDGRDGSMTRFRFFGIAIVAAGCYYILPGMLRALSAAMLYFNNAHFAITDFLFTALSTFSYICWIWPSELASLVLLLICSLNKHNPDNIVVNQLFGVSTGLGMGVFVFDWGQIAYIGSPLITPWWAIVNIFAGFVFFYWLLTPILYYTNVSPQLKACLRVILLRLWQFWNFAYMPIWSTDVYDRYGEAYDIDSVLDSSRRFNATAYEEYSPLFMNITYITIYSIAFTLSTAAIVHTALYHGQSVIRKLRNVRTEAEDVHAKLMRNYPEVPDWWYAIYGLIFIGLSIVAIEVCFFQRVH